MSRNLGEQNEIFLKTFLLMMFYKKKPLIGNHNIGIIDSLKFSPDGKLPEWKKEYEILLQKRDYNSLKSIFPKAPTGSKADLEINGVRYSVKNKLGAKSAIVNHTNRAGFLRVFKLLNLDISKLDKIIDEYWDKRISGKIKEDINNKDINSPFSKNKEYLKPVLEYFLFTGTGSKDSNFPADKVLIFDQPEDTQNYVILSKSQTVDSLWDDLTFSIRSKKGMPNVYDAEIHKDLSAWVRNHQSTATSPKGSLHIRS
jgi:hypothetical protein